MGERLEIASWGRKPRASICAIAFATTLYFFDRWISAIEGRRASFGLNNPGILRWGLRWASASAGAIMRRGDGG
jgi:hypothetical protein